ncbi:uncharacterized protein BP01DRAFT_224648 [Aspergillus saccharolyticus JOP 1030-1]|uniref:Uncharacterized protein n=1 Tax=Aspergillus saccharolyticus JOP 1030-1 TaxID=1450539 RepID=A0A318YZ83_9EURO|nr:hypothetical protein BP01DRAFT_224648 [Aspergillus saccharolyticus JOP 1030-1]PYH40285.1 hypothetical protein BP01DRAFT_224648 [Aspergillus saccharolyticus JOP 1030-1]
MEFSYKHNKSKAGPDHTTWREIVVSDRVRRPIYRTDSDILWSCGRGKFHTPGRRAAGVGEKRAVWPSSAPFFHFPFHLPLLNHFPFAGLLVGPNAFCMFWSVVVGDDDDDDDDDDGDDNDDDDTIGFFN